MRWTCKEISVSECGTHVERESDQRDLTDWPVFVRYYSRRDLSFKKDRLAAIDGLAKLLGTVRQDEYLFGFWTRDIPRQLFWMRHRDMTLNTSLPQVPAWSWASKIGAVEPFIESWLWKTSTTRAAC